MAAEAEYSERHRFLRSEGGKQLLLAIGESVSAIHWGNPRDGAAHSKHNNGSIFFINTGKGIFGVTAKHVYHGYVQRALEEPVVCQIDNLRFDPIQRLVSEGHQCDIAIFRLTDAELGGLGRLTVPWPPLIPKVGHAVLLAGLPGQEKKFPGRNVVNFSKYVAMPKVSSVNERDISMLLPPDDQLIDTLGLGLPPRQYEMAGMSGGPVALVTDSSGILAWRFSGVIYESHSSFEIVKAARADVISENGLVNG
jgi:hypothetical protein